MELSKLIHKLHYINCFWKHTANSSTEIYQCCCLKDENTLREHVLYLCTPQQLDKEMDRSEYNFLCIFSDPQTSCSVLYQNANYIELCEDAN